VRHHRSVAHGSKLGTFEWHGGGHFSFEGYRGPTIHRRPRSYDKRGSTKIDIVHESECRLMALKRRVSRAGRRSAY
jgi:hypothetical protein